ncbi:sporulation related protein [Fluviicoccus keumensis]|uniref:Sporulation related protein n=1 Tax=Fluviicoccus keumensis TaxID=1435465 RepID=A0A4Q7YF08_9GAMM|nr:SPOR domain-containing protein [Fluviicoccus keumensis]RZU35334.1 sporulation related protein [Fluviicoccus keumensis]
MPLLFGLLVMLNAVFLAWQFFEKQNTSQSVAVHAELSGKRLMLLSEQPVSANKDESGSAMVTAPKVSQDAASFCYRIGPITGNDMLTQLQNALVNSGFEVKVESLSDDVAGYIVYIPPLSSKDKAEMMAQELLAKGYEAKVMNDPQFATAVMLGNFNSQQKADALKSKLQDQGYQVETRQTLDTRHEQWLKVDSVGSSAKTQIDRIISGTPRLRREPASCET